MSNWGQWDSYESRSARQAGVLFAGLSAVTAVALGVSMGKLGGKYLRGDEVFVDGIPLELGVASVALPLGILLSTLSLRYFRRSDSIRSSILVHRSAQR